MIVNNKKIKLGVTDILLVIISIVFTAGIRGWFKVCEPMGEGFMSCHWAGETLKAMSITMLVLCIIHVFMPDEKIKIGMDIAFIGVLVFSLMIPGGVINLCMMEDMKCRSLTKPWNMGICIVWIIIILGDILLCIGSLNKEKHKRG